MTNNSTFEVEVEVYTGSVHYGYYPVESGSKAVKGMVIKDKIVKMFQFENVTRNRAIELGQKKGKVKNCRKIDAYEGLLSIEKLELEPQTSVYDKGNQYVNPIAMSEMIWQKKSARRNTIENSKKDKITIDELK